MSFLSKVYPAKQDLARRYEEIQAKLDKGHLTPGKANRALTDTLCEEVTRTVGEQGPECFSVWFLTPDRAVSVLAGWSDRGRNLAPAPTLEEGAGVRHRVVRTGRPAVLNGADEVAGLVGEILPDRPAPGWDGALVTPVETAGNVLGLGIALFTRPLDRADLEATLKLCDQLGSALATDAEGCPELA